jgi:hypothetical protein
MSLDQWRNFAPNQKLPATWTDGIEQLLSNYVSPNFVIDQPTDTTLRVKAGTGPDARTLAIQGKPRWNEADVSATVSGAAGTITVYAVSTAESFGSATGPPVQETDTTTRSFTLKANGAPSGSGGEAISRVVAIVAWDGARITGVTQLTHGALGMAQAWQDVVERQGFANAPGTNALALGQSGLGLSPATGSSYAGTFPFYLDPADYAVAGLTARMRLRFNLITGTPIPGTAITLALHPVTGYTNSVSNSQFVAGAAVTGSSVALTGASVNTVYSGAAEFAPPAAGMYALIMTPTASTAGYFVGRGVLQARSS